jgi:hypothetical protein
MVPPALKDFFVLTESVGRCYMLEPEANGTGRLLSWEDRLYASPGQDEAGEDHSYEVLARGDFDKLAAALVRALGSQLEPGTGDFARLRSLWDDAIDTGEAVHIEPPEGDGPLSIGIGPKGRKESEGSYGFEDL